MKLSVEMLDNDVNSAIINIGKNNGYIEAYIDNKDLVLNIYDKEGEIIYGRFVTLVDLKGKGWTAPKFESGEEDGELIAPSMFNADKGNK
jgi:hypothetical protein